ncbi:MAG: FecR family protein [Rhodoferax sp.]|nr:FecR family protein [Rhodoferax sp.]MDP3651826.1 FecR family protein [Rhodoferax sp.]
MQLKSVLVSCAFLFAAIHAYAAATIQSLNGDVRAEATGGAASAATSSQRLDAGATVHTGANGQAMLRFDDGQLVALSPNSSFKIEQFRYDAAKPEQNNVVMSLFRGALRMVTGLIGQRDHSKFALKTPTATIGIRGTDFMLALANQSYVQVIQGGVAATNAAGTVAFSAGTTGMVAGASTLATSVAASAIPASVGATFSSLGSLSMAAGAAATGASTGAGATGGTAGASGGAAGAASGAAGATSATAAAAGGVGAAGLTAGVVAAAVVAVVSTPTTTTGTTGTTGTTSP